MSFAAEHEPGFSGPKLPPALAPELVNELINPEISSSLQSDGQEAQREALYRLVENSSDNIMGQLITTVGTYIDPDSPGNEHNQIQISRLIDLVDDMPLSLPQETLLDTWEQLIRSDWLYSHGDILVIARALANKFLFPEIGTLVFTTASDVLTDLGQKFATEFGYSDDVLPIDYQDFDIVRALEARSKLEQAGMTAANVAYTSMIGLAMILSQVSAGIEVYQDLLFL